ncbi:FeoA family protein [Clostridium cylindrosporum]|uniref:Ferrous ion uptake protein A n=1 Tax=Clostridium cylindrosporum DSM 605 TaxID=1121307 RepID=A0A0J8D569_CLOCY|nr:ferrous iron transport protein A [Clostridium cylindrosporum]KMT21305.1 ferrous ion uptake protein A [Clostridium cylindrosporum DSM 605]
MKLSDAKRGQSILIKKINDANIKIQAIRLGLYEGAKVNCSAKIPFGPVVLSSRMQEIAIGRNLAENIEIELM